ncbi:hypothetical protein STEG23_004075, partial [Scotinomys teguina]
SDLLYLRFPVLWEVGENHKDLKFLSYQSFVCLVSVTLKFVYMVYYIDRFLYVEPSLHPWDEAYLVMVDNFFDVFLDSVCQYFVDYSYINVHQGDWASITFLKSFLVMNSSAASVLVCSGLAGGEPSRNDASGWETGSLLTVPSLLFMLEQKPILGVDLVSYLTTVNPALTWDWLLFDTRDVLTGKKGIDMSPGGEFSKQYADQQFCREQNEEDLTLGSLKAHRWFGLLVFSVCPLRVYVSHLSSVICCSQPASPFGNNSDLIACTVITKDGGMVQRFLAVDIYQMSLVEPDVSRLGWGVVKFAGLLQDMQVTGVEDDSRALNITIHKPASSPHSKPFPILQATFVFSDHIRCIIAKQRLAKGRIQARRMKMQRIAALLDLPIQPTTEVLGFGSSSQHLPFRFYDQCRRGSSDPTVQRSVFASVDKVPALSTASESRQPRWPLVSFLLPWLRDCCGTLYSLMYTR